MVVDGDGAVVGAGGLDDAEEGFVKAGGLE